MNTALTLEGFYHNGNGILCAGSFKGFQIVVIRIAKPWNHIPKTTLTGIIWLRYFLIAGLFFWGLWMRPEDRVRATRLAAARPTRAIVAHEIRMSLVSSVIYAVPGTIVVAAYKAGGTAIYTDIAAMGGPWLGWAYLITSVFLYLFIHDTYFYWTHRAMHLRAFFRATHLTHHRSRQPTAWAAFSFHPWEAAISAWPLPLAAFFIPIHLDAVVWLLVIMTYCSVANHAGWEIMPARLLALPPFRWLITARHHNVHHTNYQANFGLYFRFWDLVCKTDRGLAEPYAAPAGRPAPAE